MLTPDLGPQRIVCLTEETTEWLYLLGQEARIVGISGYTVRPRRARQEKPRVSAFLTAKIDQILALEPDCVFGFSDLQADIASALIRQGVQVTVFNQRSIAEIFGMMFQVAAMVGQGEHGLTLIREMQQQRAQISASAASLPRRPRVYFEEWDEPHISAIRWVSELLGVAGGDDCFPELSVQSLGKNRIIAEGAEIVRRNPDIIFGSWCGKKFRPNLVAQRAGANAQLGCGFHPAFSVLNGCQNHLVFAGFNGFLQIRANERVVFGIAGVGIPKRFGGHAKLRHRRG